MPCSSCKTIDRDGLSNAGSFREFVGGERWFVAPVLQWDITPATQAQLELDHFSSWETPDNVGLFAFGDRPYRGIPKERNLGDPTDFQNFVQDIVGLTLSHAFNDRWKLTARFNAESSAEEDGGAFGDSVTDDDVRRGILPRATEDGSIGLGERGDSFTHALLLNLTGKFSTAALTHTLLLGGDYYHRNEEGICCGLSGFHPVDISIHNPVHGVTVPADVSHATRSKDLTQWYGFYMQDQVELPWHLFALAGFRYDDTQAGSDTVGSDPIRSSDAAVSPRGGLLWQPVPWLSLYGSYTENFGADNGSQIGRDNRPLPSESAQQWEFGVKAEALGGRVTTSVAYYDLTKQNVATSDPLFPTDGRHGLVIGAANSHGVEFDFAGELLPGWNIIANYAYTVAKVTRDQETLTDDNGNLVEIGPGSTGHRMANVPRHGGRWWTTYTFHGGAADGMFLGGGATLRAQRFGNLANDFVLPGFVTVDSVIAYRFRFGRSQLTAQLSCNNLLNQEYYESSFDFGRARIVPGASRAFLGSLRLEI